jgi:hypothetical protein
MIKINLLPGYILERRRVKALVMLLAVVLIVELLGFAAYVWAPGPFSLASKKAKADARRQQARSDAQIVEGLEAEIGQVQRDYAAKQLWVRWVEDADSRPPQWTEYIREIRKYIPADVVVNGLQPPSGNVLNLSGQTSDVMAAVRWYLNMLRCELVMPDANAVTLSTTTGGWPDQILTGANPKMQHSVSLQVALRPEELLFMQPVAPPAGAGGGATVGRGRMGGGPGMGGGGRMGGGARMGGGPRRGGGRGMRGGGRGMRGGGRRGGMRGM